MMQKISKAELAARLEARVECAEGGVEGLNILLYGKYVCFLSSTLHASVAFAATEHMRMPLPSVASSYLAPAVTSTPSTMITSGVSSSPRQHIIRGEAQDDVVPAEVKCEVFGDRYGHLLDRRWGSLLGGIYP